MAPTTCAEIALNAIGRLLKPCIFINSIHLWYLIRPASCRFGLVRTFHLEGKQDSILKFNLTITTMAVLITANSANTICFALTCALFAATCHASSSGHDYKIRDSSPSLQHTADAISSEHTRSNRKLMAVKSDWTPLWADEFDSWDGERWQHHW